MIVELLQQGYILKTNGYYKHAIEIFYKALELDNTSQELLLEIAECYYLMGEEERALGYIEQVLEKEPTHVEALNLLKNIFITKKAYDKAEQVLFNIYKITNSELVLSEVLYVMNEQKHYKKVIGFKDKCNTSKSLYEIAKAYFFLNDLEEAKVVINKALSSDNCRDYRALKSKILFKQNFLEEASALLDGITLEENNPDTLNFLGIVKQYEGDYSIAIKCFLKAINCSPKSAEYHYNCASTYFKLNEIALAKKYYNLAISLEPENQNYHFALANLYYSQKKYRKALEELTDELYEAKILKAIILSECGYLALALKEFEKLLEEKPADIVVSEYYNKIKEKMLN